MYCVDQDGEIKSAIFGSVVQDMPSQEDESVTARRVHIQRVDILGDELTQVLWTTELFKWSFHMCPRVWTTHTTS